MSYNEIEIPEEIGNDCDHSFWKTRCGRCKRRDRWALVHHNKDAIRTHLQTLRKLGALYEMESMLEATLEEIRNLPKVSPKKHLRS